MSSELEATQELNLIPDSETVFGRKRRIVFDNLIGEHVALANHIKQLEAEKKKLSEKIQSWLADHDTKTVMSQGHRVTLAQGSSSHLSKEKLIDAGVPASVIVKATTVREYVYVLVTAPKK